MKKPDTRVQYTKHVLKEALLEIMKEKPVDRISVKELCEAAGLNRGTFYLHYASPRSLLSDVEADFTRSLMERFSSYWSSHRKMSFMQELFSAIDSERDMFRVLMSPNGDPQFTQQLTAMARENVLDEWAREFPAYERDDLGFVFNYVFSGAATLIGSWLSGEIAMEPAHLAQRLERLGHHSLMAIGDFDR